MGHTLIIDNYDSFTWNVYADVAVLGGDPLVRRNDKITIEEIEALYETGDIERIIISPGPGHPRTDSGVSRDVITWGCGKLPILGVCMGLECIVDVLGGDIAYAGEIKHGKTSLVQHDAIGIFHDLPPLLQSTRYHSLAAKLVTLPSELAVSATTQESGVIMAVRHRRYCLEAVQYHPESCMSEGGRGLMANFLKMKGGFWVGENAWCGVEAEQPNGQAYANGETSRDGAKANGVANGVTKASGKNAASLPTILERIHTQRLLDVETSSSTPWATPAIITKSLALHTAPAQINLIKRIQSTPHTAIMAEIKRASPSKGDIALNTSAPEQALKYALAGASVISVLTEPKWFKGGLTDMLAVRQAIDSLPNRPCVLRKDFILAPYQIDEARLYGADTVLLIVAMLNPTLLRQLYDYSLSLGMEPLVEVNNPTELQLALEIGAKVIGVNNRNLHDFNVDMDTTSRVNAALNGKEVILCALSGITGPADVAKYVGEGVRAVLVGEALMRAKDVGAFLRELIGLSPPPPKMATKPLVKICGVRSVQDAESAISAGADMIGIILVPGTKRFIPTHIAAEISIVVRSARAKASSNPTAIPSGPEPWFAYHARQLLSRKKPLLVGVFQNQPLDDIVRAVDEIGLDLVQLHGDEPQAWTKLIPVPVIKCFRISADGRITGGDVDRPGLNQYILLDTAGSGGSSGGGEGKSFNWDVARDIITRGEAGSGGASPLPILMAGGLEPGNVQQAVEKAGMGLLGVDVSSGVEIEGGGRKDSARITDFIQAAKA